MLDASNFFVAEDIFTSMFHRICELVIDASFKLVKNHKLIDKNEEYIRNILVEKYLKRMKHTHDLQEILFDVESGVINDNFEILSYIDIKISNVNLLLPGDDDSYFAFECKILDGSSTKTRLYIEEGIKRFVELKYAKEMSIAGMIGFVKICRIEEVIKNINGRLSRHNYINTMENLKCLPLIESFNYSYKSKHKRTRKQPPISLYHIMINVN